MLSFSRFYQVLKGAEPISSTTGDRASSLLHHLPLSLLRSVLSSFWPQDCFLNSPQGKFLPQKFRPLPAVMFKQLQSQQPLLDHDYLSSPCSAFSSASLHPQDKTLAYFALDTACSSRLVPITCPPSLAPAPLNFFWFFKHIRFIPNFMVFAPLFPLLGNGPPWVFAWDSVTFQLGSHVTSQ